MSLASVADLTGVSAEELSRVVRMACTADILCEPMPGWMAHTPLSEQFVRKPSLLDAVACLADTMTPASLTMAATSRKGVSCFPSRRYALAAKFEEEPRLKRQLAVLERLVVSNAADNIVAAVTLVEWRQSIDPARIVEVSSFTQPVLLSVPPLTRDPQVNANSNAAALALSERYHHAGIIVQTQDERVPQSFSSHVGVNHKRRKINVQNRPIGTPQKIQDASIYILNLPTPSLTTSSSTLLKDISSELKAHFRVLRNNIAAVLIVVARILPNMGMLDSDVEALVRMQDLWQLQMGHDRLLDVSRFVSLLDEVRDSQYRLVITGRLSCSRHPTMAFEVQIRPVSDISAHDIG